MEISFNENTFMEIYYKEVCFHEIWGGRTILMNTVLPNEDIVSWSRKVAKYYSNISNSSPNCICWIYNLNDSMSMMRIVIVVKPHFLACVNVECEWKS